MLNASVAEGQINEYLSELGFLLSSRLVYDLNTEFTWADDIERQQRIEAHLDALVLAGSRALRQCKKALDSYDDDLVIGAAYTLACTEENDGINAVTGAFGKVEQAYMECYVAAFKQASQANMALQLKPYLNHASPHHVAAAIEILGYRREGDPKQFWSLLRHDSDDVRMAAIIALTRFGYKEALPAIEQMVWARPINDREVFLYPLLALGSDKARQYIVQLCRNPALNTPESLIYLSLSAGNDQLSTFMQNFSLPDSRLAALQALGIYGHLDAVPYLLTALQSEQDAERAQAGEALQMITGAGLREELFVREKEEPDLTVAEVLGQESSENTKAYPLTEPPAPRLMKVIRYCSDYSRWQRWWRENQGNFRENIRYRHGSPFSLKSCINTLANDPNANAEQRNNAYAELVIRSGNPVAFEPDWFVSKQNLAITQWQQWWQTVKATLEAQQWLFNGQ